MRGLNGIKQKSILGRSVADGLCSIFDKVASNILQKQFSSKQYLIINTLNKIFTNEIQFSLRGLYPFLENPIKFILKKVESCADLKAEEKLIMNKFLLSCSKNLDESIKEKIIAFFLEKGYIDVNHLLREALRIRNTQLIFFLIREQKADINKITRYLPGASLGFSAISYFIPICKDYPLMSETFLSILFDYGFNPQSRHPYYYAHPSIPWLNLQTQIALSQVKLKLSSDCRRRFKDSYIKIIMLQIKLVISTILDPLILPVLRQIIFEYININEVNPIDLQSFDRFVKNKDPSQLLTQEIKQYNREVRTAFCFGLFSENNHDDLLRNKPTPYDKALSLVFQFAGVDRSDDDKLYSPYHH